MKILALDIGAGTEDVLLYDDGKKGIENCIKIVLPSPSQVFAEKVREATRLYKGVSIEGDIIGGGAFAYALRNHVEKGLRVMMTKNAAYTVRNVLNEVRDLGIKIITEEEYVSKVSYQWTKKTLENHLLGLEWYKLIKAIKGKYKLTIPILSSNKIEDLNSYIVQFAKNWIVIIKKLIHEIQNKNEKLSEKSPLLNILIDKAVEELYSLLKEENLLPKGPNLKALWAEELRKVKFEDWISVNF